MAVQALRSPPFPVRALLRLGKPRVVSLIVFTAIIGMFLATLGLPPAGPPLFGAIGIGLLATSAAALNCAIEPFVTGLVVGLVGCRSAKLGGAKLSLTCLPKNFINKEYL